MYIVRLYTETTSETAKRRHRDPDLAVAAAERYLRGDPSLLSARVMTADRKICLKVIDRQ